MNDILVAVVLVTFNRLDKLKIALQNYAKQQYIIDTLIVVNNNSSDNTQTFLEEWKKENEGFNKVVINLKENLGGSGGFYVGEKYALENTNADWIMVADDDAYPNADYIDGMVRYLKEKHDYKIAVVCGAVMELGHLSNIHRTLWNSRFSWNFHTCVEESEFSKEMIEIDFSSYVGAMMSREAIIDKGLINPRFFIWNDDTEHMYRLRHYGKIICLPKFKMIHDVDVTNKNLSWKSYYSYRNKTYFFKHHLPVYSVYVLTIIFIKSVCCILKGKSVSEMILRVTAIKNGLRGKLGIHPVYKPGWKPKQ